MIISHKYRYLFIQFPFAASTAIGRELIEFYDGEPILFKHAAYHDFASWAGKKKNDYLICSSIRNPFDQLVSIYFKIKNNPQGFFTNPQNFKENGGHITATARRRYNYLQRNNCSFEEYLLRFYKLPYVDWSVLDHKRFDFIIRCENLQSDFFAFLRMVGIDQVRPLPLVNKTPGVCRDKQILFPSGSIQHAVRIVGPMMEYWNYKFPLELGSEEPRRYDRLLFELMKVIKSAYWRHFWYLTRGSRRKGRQLAMVPGRRIV